MANRHIVAFAALLLSFLPTGYAQKSKPEPGAKTASERVDTRIDNMEYWMEMAERGLVPYNPDVIPAPAVYKGDRILTRGVRTANSPDVPLTTLTTVTESENSVFVDPDNANYILNSNNSTSWSGSSVGSVYGANYFQSTNAGIGWSGTTGGAGGSNSGDPTTAIGRNGREYVNFISSASGQGIAYSDNGSTWNTATIAPNPGSLADKNHMWIDNKLTSPYEGNLYVAWTDFGGTDDTHIKISRSTDDGVTWSTPLKLSGAINAGSHNQGVNIQTGPAGQVYVAWAVYDSWPSDESAIGFAKSTDGGATFGAASRVISNIRGIRNTAVLKNHRVNSFPCMAVDISNGPYSGNIYIVWTNTGVPGTNTGTNKSVYLIRSSNGGTTWSTPVRINQGTFADGKEAYFPWISCDPETGVLTAVFYDDRNVSSTQCEVYSAYSTDGGQTWTDFVVSDVAFTPAPISGLASLYMGDYLGITSKGGKVYPCWTDNRSGVAMTYVSPYELGLNANFTASATTICKGSTVTYTDVSTGPPSTWTWSFPGGTPSTYVGQTPPAIAYNTASTYDVSLTVTDATGTDTEVKSGFITVKNVMAGFSATPTTVVVGNTVTFTNSSQCGATSWTWSFPGGTPSTYVGQTPPAITYSTTGTYNVTLIVSNASGSDTLTRTGYITVAPPIYIMSNSTVFTCGGDFYDTGGDSGSYQSNETYVMTFYASTPGAMIRFAFSSFNTESGYDTLTIYDGPNSSYPVIGKYHGSTGPGTVTSSNVLGGLTFRFHSDVSVVGTGWAAAISCVLPPVANPATFTATGTSSSQINLAWTKNTSSDDVMVVWSPTSVFGTPVDGTVYTAGSSIPGGGTVLYRGSLTNFNHTGLTPLTTYYYKAYSYDGTNVYSSGITASSATLCGTGALPFSESFAYSTLPNCWTKQIVGTNAIDKWTVSNTNSAGGTPYEMQTTWQSVNPGITRLVTPPINTMGISQLNLSFKHYLDGYSTGSTLRIQSSSDGTNWTNEAWSLAATSANVGPETINTTIQSNVNSLNTLIAFTIEGDLYQYDYWYIDDVMVTAGCATYSPVSVAIVPSLNGVCAGTPVTFTATPVNGGTTPAYQWKVNAVNAANATNATYTYTPVNGDQVTCVLTSNATCVTGNPATSNTVVMTVNTPPVAGVSISASANPVCQGTGVTFTATPTNGGSAPAFQWKVNGTNVTNATNSTFTYTPASGNQVSCVMISGLSCVTGSPVTSNTITMSLVTPTPAGVSINVSVNPVCSGSPVTFTATPVNGGIAPVYQWKVNSIGAPATTNASFSYIPQDGDVVNCTMTSNSSCVTTTIANSNSIDMGVIPIAMAGITVTASANPVCQGSNATFTATPINGGTAPTYHWKVNGSYVANATNATYTYKPASGDQVTCVMTSSASCITGSPATSNTVTMSIQPPVPAGVSVSVSANPVCSGSGVTFTATPVNGGSAPHYVWKVNSIGAPATTNSTFFYYPQDGDVVNCVITSNSTCVTTTTAYSNSIEMAVTPTLTAGVILTASANPACQGALVTFSANPVNGGNAPVYVWKVNSIGAPATTNATFSITPQENDVVNCVMTSNASCVGIPTVSSNYIEMTVNPLLVAGVTISPSANPVCSGSPVTFTAAPFNGGSAPVYQWKINDSNAADATNATYTYSPVGGDQVTCVLTSSESCITGSPATSNPVTMTVNPQSVPTIAISASSNPACQGAEVTFSSMITNGGDAPSFQWKVNGVNAANAINASYSFIPVNGDQVACVLTSNASCILSATAESNTLTMTVKPYVAARVTVLPSANPVCSGTSVTFTTSTVNGGTAPVYQWKINAANVPNATNASYAYIPANGDQVSVVMTSNYPCALGNPATAAPVTMTVSSILSLPGITITPSSNPICQGAAVTFTSLIINGGSVPVYQWRVNGVNAPGATNDSFTYVPSNGDAISCRLTASTVCTLTPTVFSNTVALTVDPTVVPSVTIAVSSNPFAAGQTVTFTATNLGGGSTPMYQWKVNDVNASGATNASYIFTPSDGDQVSCVMTSSANCTTVNPVTSNVITMTALTMPLSIIVQNETITDSRCYEAYQTIIVAGGSTLFTVLNGGSATFIAGSNILYYPGTRVDSGGYMTGYIAPAGPWCNTQSKVVSAVPREESGPVIQGDAYRIYPNPARDRFFIENITDRSTATWMVEIYDMNGTKVDIRFLDEKRVHEFSLAGKPAGIYLVRVITDAGSGTTRIIKL